jgi:uncharacterized protein involved in exopolysaccharide biosynthesis
VVVVRRRWLVIAATVITVAGAVSVSLLQTPIYSSSSEILVQPRNAGGPDDLDHPYGAPARHHLAMVRDVEALSSRIADLVPRP